MISVCYLSSTRRRRTRSRWCWAPAPGGCWMWLGREQKTTKTTVWCTAKVSKQLRSAVISPQRSTPQSSSTPFLPDFLFLSLFSFTVSPLFLFSKSQIFTKNPSAQTRTCTHVVQYSIFPKIISVTKTMIEKSYRKIFVFILHKASNAHLSYLKKVNLSVNEKDSR